jgi:hypothetical protein
LPDMIFGSVTIRLCAIWLHFSARLALVARRKGFQPSSAFSPSFSLPRPSAQVAQPSGPRSC